MLPRGARLTESGAFRRAVRTGRRSGSRTVVVHWAPEGPEQPGTPQIGFVVSKAVGNAVVRNRVKRRLRHLTRELLTERPGRGVLVVRALPAAADASYDSLRVDLRRCVSRAVAPRATS